METEWGQSSGFVYKWGSFLLHSNPDLSELLAAEMAIVPLSQVIVWD